MEGSAGVIYDDKKYLCFVIDGFDIHKLAVNISTNYVGWYCNIGDEREGFVYGKLAYRLGPEKRESSEKGGI